MSYTSCKITKRDSIKRLSSLMQHKLRVILKCYTVVDFVLNEDNTFSLRKTHKKRGIRFEETRTTTGRIELVPINDEFVRLKIWVNQIKKK